MDRSIRFDDPEISIDWGISNPVLSEKMPKHHCLKIVIVISIINRGED